MPPVVCTVCNGQKFKNETAYSQHVKDSASHRDRERLQQRAPVKVKKANPQVTCTVCGGKVFKDVTAYSNHVRDSKDHRAKVARKNVEAVNASSSRLGAPSSASSTATPLPPPIPKAVSPPPASPAPSGPSQKIEKVSLYSISVMQSAMTLHDLAGRPSFSKA